MNQEAAVTDQVEKVERWTVDKKIPLALVATLGVQAVALIVWAASLYSTVQQLQTNDHKMDTRIEKVEQAVAGLPLLQYQVTGTSQAVERIESKVDTLADRAR